MRQAQLKKNVKWTGGLQINAYMLHIILMVCMAYGLCPSSKFSEGREEGSNQSMRIGGDCIAAAESGT